VQRGSVGTFVYLVNADNTVSVRKISVGATQGTTIAVTDGLQPGDRVVIDGSDRLRDGMHVVVGGAPAAGGGTGNHTRHAKGAGQHAQP
jgi:multidrug efflux system membrane fusion protein